jgi:hypothetical protein
MTLVWKSLNKKGRMTMDDIERYHKFMYEQQKFNRNCGCAATVIVVAMGLLGLLGLAFLALVAVG